MDQIYVFYGFGEAGYGIANILVNAMVEEGLTISEAKMRIYPCGRYGLVFKNMSPHQYQAPFARDREEISEWKLRNLNQVSLHDTVQNTKATVLIGASGQDGAFTYDLLRQMGKNTDRPIILPLSNPTKNSECTPEEAYKATNGNCFIATGSPFPPVKIGGRERNVTQCNNMYLFPGVGFDAIVSMTQKITDNMFMQAAKSVSAMVSKRDVENGTLLPDLNSIRDASVQVAFAVAKEARDSGLGIVADDEKLLQYIKNSLWYPEYLPYRYME